MLEKKTNNTSIQLITKKKFKIFLLLNQSVKLTENIIITKSFNRTKKNISLIMYNTVNNIKLDQSNVTCIQST